MYAEYKETELKAFKTYSTSFNSYKFKPRAKYEQEDGWLVTLTYLLALSSSSSMAGRLSFFPEVLVIFILAN